MHTFHSKFRLLHFVLAGAIFFASFPGAVFARDDEPKTANVGFKVTGQVVEIYYDLLGPTDQVYTVTVLLKRRFDKTFVHTPIAVSGDVGPAVIPGENKRVTWKLGDEFPKGLPGEDCFFMVEAEAGGTPTGGISTYVWIAGGAAVLGGVLAAVLLSKGSNGTQPPPASDFPAPPARP